MHHTDLLYQLKQQKIQLWAKADGNLGFSFDQKTGFAADLKARVAAAKPALLDILRHNGVDTEQRALAVEVYRTPAQYRQRALSDMQKGIFLQAGLDSLPYSYNVPFFVEVHGMGAAEAQAAVRALLARHDMLRLRIGADMSCDTFDVEALTVTHAAIDADAIAPACQQRYQQPFQLAGGPLVQAEILSVRGTGRVIVNLTHHHILSDAFSVGVLLRDLIELTGRPAGATYWDFLAYQQALLGSADYEAAAARLAGRLDAATALPAATKRRGPTRNQAGVLRLEVDNATCTRLRAVALDQGVSLYALLLTGLYQTLSVHHGGQADFPIGLTISNRPFALDDAVGPFISTLPLVPDWQPAATLAANARSVNGELAWLNEHQHLNLNLLAARLPHRAEDIGQLMHVMFTMHNFRGADAASGQGAQDRCTLLPVAEEVEKFGLSVTATELADRIALHVSYAADLYRPEYVAALCASYLDLLATIDHARWTQPVGTLGTAPAPAHEPIQPVAMSLAAAFEAQAAGTPDAAAIASAAGVLSYRALNERANRLAGFLKEEHGVGQESPVAVWFDGTADAIVAMLATIKAGGCYVPLSVSFPAEKIDYILGHTRPKVVLSHGKLGQRAGDVPTLLLDDTATEAAVAAYPAANLALGLAPSHLAYVMYTSGTTSNPKGVMVEHGGIVSLVRDAGYIDIAPSDVVLQLADLGFDAATFEIWGALLNGARLVIPGDKLALLSDIGAFKAELQRQGVSVLWLTKTLFDQLYGADETVFAGLRCLLVGGEALNKTLMEKLATSPHKPAHLINGYGPTENTTFSCTLAIERASLALADTVLIGKPLRNRSAFVLDGAGRPCRDFAIGELHVGGNGVARSYLHNPELSRTQFIANPFRTEAERAAGVHATLYRTGDMVRRLPSGELEYLGRRDQQVKLRGYRVELAEIEEALLRCAGVLQAAAVIRKIGGADHLLAYYAGSADEAALKAQLARALPAYMVPSRCIALDALPLTQNGKLDQARLAVPSLVAAREYVAPRSEQERAICAILAGLLGVADDQVGCRDDFFALGGNSMLAIGLASKINQALKASVTARTVYEHKTVEQLAAAIAASQQGFAYEAFLIDPAAGEADRFAPFPLTNVQQAYQLGRSSSFGLGNVATHIYQEHAFTSLDVGRLESSLNALIARHPALRTVFGESTQRILEQTPRYRIAVHDFLAEGSLEAYREALSHKVYDLSVFPLFDVAVSSTRAGIVLHLSFDALLMDAHSFRIFFDEWTLLYNEAQAALPRLELSYRDYVCRYDAVRTGPQFATARAYWENKLDDYNFDLRLPTVANAQQIATPTFSRVTRTIAPAVWQKLQDAARDAGISPTVVLLALYGEVVCFWSGQDNVCINLTLFNRLPLHPQVNDIVGDFTVLELFNYVRARDTAIAPLLRAANQALWDDIDHNLFDGIDFQRLARSRKAIPADQALAPVVFTSLIGNTSKYQKSGVFIDASYGGESYSITQTSQVWLDNKAYENRDGLVVEWDYVEQLFDATLVADMHAAYCRLIETLADRDWQAALPRLAPTGADLQLVARANAALQQTSEGTLFGRCERSDAVAVIDSQGEYTYAQLLDDSARLARHLVGGAGALVGVLCEKGYGQVVATMAIMQAGQAYLPLHVEWPAGRIDTILRQGEVTTLLVSAKQANCAEIRATLADGYRLLVIEDLLAQAEAPVVTLPEVAADDLAYVIFTSGSTGVPKGVSISHRGALNTIDAVNRRFHVGPQDRVLALSELSFDLSVYDLFGLLAAGGAIVFPEQDKTKQPEHWLELMQAHGVTIWNTVPQLAELMAEQEVSLPALRVAMVSGDWVPTGLAARLKACAPDVRVMSLGGATEGSIWSIWHEIETPVPHNWTSIPYGVAMPNQKMYVMNDGAHCPVGVIGEIHIGGAGVALNYWGDATKTAASFFQHPTLGRLYRTGDLGRWHRDGYIEFAGRKDTQLKLRGYRVELGEIEHAMAALADVKQAVVLAKDDPALGTKYLVAYYVAAEAQDHEAMQAALRQRLPEYMIPAVFMHLEALPLTANGKVDSARLPAVEAASQQHCVAPRSELERTVCTLWAAALGLQPEQVGIRNEFFHLGGDSIISIQLSSKLRQQLGVAVTIQDIFTCKTVEGLCRHLQRQAGAPERAILSEQGELTGAFPLLPIQSWFFENDFPVAHHWNQSFLVRVPALDLDRLRAALAQLVAQHDALRLRFHDGMQHYAPAEAIALRTLDVSAVSETVLQDTLTAWQSGFDLAAGPLCSVGYLHGYADGSARVFFALHHLVVDTISWNVLAEDLQAAYEGRALPAKMTSYRQWVASVAHFAQERDSQRDFWTTLLADADRTALASLRDEDQRSVVRVELDRAATQSLLGGNRAYHTQVNDLLLAALASALTTLTGQPTHHVLLEGHGREEAGGDTDISRTVGWFATLYPVRLASAATVGEIIVGVKEHLRAIPDKGLAFGALLGYRRGDMPAIRFNYLGQLGEAAAPRDWQVQAEAAGHMSHAANVLANLLDVGGAVIGGCLRFDVAGTLRADALQRFADAFGAALETVADHCAGKHDAQYTASDFRAVSSEADLRNMPLLPSAGPQDDWFDMTEIQKVYLLGRLANYEIGNVSNHVYHEYYYEELDVARLEAVLNAAIRTYPVLRTVFSYDLLKQRFLPLDGTPHYRIACHEHPDRDINAADVAVVRDRLSHKVYDAERFALFTYEVSRFRNGAVLHISTDLILLDAHSRQALFEVIDRAYRDAGYVLQAPSITFHDYQKYYQLLRQSAWYEADKAYWLDKIERMPLRPELPFLVSPESVEYPKFTEHTLYVEADAWDRFKEQARRHDVSYSSVLLGLYGAVLSYFSGHREFLITMTLFNRYAIHEEVDALWGDFTSTNLFHFKGAGRRLLDTLRTTHADMWADIGHALFTGMDVQRELSRRRKLNASKAVSPIVFTGLVGSLFDELESNRYLDDTEDVEQRFWSGQTSQAWVDLQAIEVNGRFMSKWLYVDQLFSNEYVGEMNKLYCALIAHLADADWAAEVDLFQLPPQDEALVARANAAVQQTSEGTLFGRRQRSDAIAVIDSQGEYTYAQLLDDSARLARHLVGGAGALVGVLCEKGYGQVVATMAVMQAGQAYLPLHVEWPAGRIDTILRQGEVATLLVSAKQAACAEIRATLADAYRLLVIEDLLAQAEAPAVALPDVAADDLAYVIFTSGSTGVPKGVSISHRGALNTIDAVNRRFHVGPQDRVLALSELSFDLSVYDLFGLLAAGGAIVFPDQDKTKQPEHWLDLMQTHGVTIWNTVPQLAELMAEQGASLPALRVAMVSGDWVPTGLAARLKACAPGVRVMSLGGATEGSIWSIWHEIETPVPHNWTSIPYGVAMPNQKMYVINDGEHCPVGVIGEIHIGGAGVALNYWGDAAKTAASFFQHPTLGRLYRTGDLGRWHRDGYIEFAGRKDTQLKLRGYRVELGEIEHAMAALADVKQAVVVAKDDPSLGTKYLAAYYVSAAAQDHEVMKSALRQCLPDYMIPAVFMQLEALPLTANGKVDNARLPAPDVRTEHSYVAPRSEQEQAMCVLWANALGLTPEQVGIRDEFFQLGGDSIISIQLSSKLRQQLGVAVTIQDIFTYKTVEGLCQYLQRQADAPARTVQSEQGQLEGGFALLPIQSWFFQSDFAAARHWNQAFLIRTPALDEARLRGALQTVVAQHDALRLRFHDGLQHYTAPAAVALRTLDVSAIDAAELQDTLTAWQAGFDLVAGPVHAFGYLHGYADGSARVFMALHHLVVDTVSWRVLADDLHAAYEGEALPAKLTSYRQWVQAVERYEVTQRAELRYWMQELDSAEPLPLAVVPGPVSDHEVTLDRALTASLLQHCNGAYHTQINDLLLTAFAHALQAVSGRATHHILLEGHGREDIDSTLDVSRTVGWFTTLFPVALTARDDLGASIKANKEYLRAVPNKGIGFGALMGYAQPKLPAIAFNYLGRMDGGQAGTWDICAEPAGVAIAPENAFSNDIGVVAMVQGEQLRCQLYTRFGAAVTRQLAEAFEAQLAAIVQHCAGVRGVEYTASDFAAVASENDLAQLPLLRGEDADGWFDMTAVQRAYLVGRLGNYEIGNISNHIYNEYCYRRLDVAALQRVLDTLIAHHDVLRTVYSFERLQQRCLPLAQTAPFKVRVHECHGQGRSEAALDAVRARLSHKVYDATTFPLFTFEVSRFDDCDVLHISIDLILLDAQSRQALFTEMDRLYRDPSAQVALPAIGFKDYQDYIGHLKHSRWYEADRQYWLDKLPAMPLRPELPFLVAPESIVTPQFSDHTLYVEHATWLRFKEQSRKYGVSYSSVLLGLYGAVLAHFSGYREFLITMTVFNRYAVHEDVNRLWGDFTSTNLFHFQDFGSDLLKTLKQSHDTMWQDIDHGLFNGIDVQRELARRHKLDGNKAVSPIVFTGIVGNLLDQTEKSYWLDDSEIVEQRDWSAQTSQAWIDLQAIEVNGQFMSKWLYVDQLFSNEYMGEMNTLYCALIRHLAAADWETLTDLFRLPAQAEALIDNANAAVQETSEGTLFDRCERSDAVAVIDSQGEYTYAQLLDDSARLARHLVGGAGALVGVLCEKGYGQVVATMAIMQAGKAYLPLHVEWPAGRIDTILRQGEVTTLLVSAKQAACAGIRATLADAYRLLVIEDLLAQAEAPAVSLPEVAADDLAYVIFTSGSTGVPKGVSISHRGALNTIDAVNRRFHVGPQDRVLALSELSFDLSVYDLFGLLAAGGAIVFPDQDKTKQPEHWLELMQAHGVTIWNTVPQLAELMAEQGESLPALRVAMVSGDWVPTGLAARLKACAPDVRVMSLGGATEGSIWSIWHEIETPVPHNWTSIPYGVAMPNQKMYVLNDGAHCPVGVIGEIHIGGAGVALNYWGDAAKTAASFFQHPTLGRLYRTGDLGRWHRDGYIEFAGRKDSQLKLRGYRVELGEIEHALAALPGVRQAIVQARDDQSTGVKFLVAYYVAEEELAEDALKAALRRNLPEYMIPTCFLHLPAMPLTANGKVDATRLPAPDRSREPARLQPASALEAQLCEIWSEVLGIDRAQIGMEDNFFDLGGNSILMIRMKSRIDKVLQHGDLQLTDLFKYTSVAQLAAILDGDRQATQAAPAPAARQHTGIETDIAVVAVNGSFPKAADVAGFWDNIVNGAECFDTLDLASCELQGVPARFVQHPDYVPTGGSVADIDKFDPAFWNLSVNDAKLIDPQIRKFLECAWQALELAGHIRDRRQLSIGVYAGMSESKYSEARIHGNPELADGLMTFGTAHLNEKDYLATRISYLLGLTGPALNINTACSTSLVAIAEACKNLSFGECDVALAGGVSLPMPDNHGYLYQPGGIFARDGHCRTFDDQASGTVGGAGVGVVVLKRLSDAVRDGNNVIAVVKGYAVNNDGDRKAGYMAPSIVGQARCIADAQRRANIDAASIGYVECHGTGTAIGDPIEIAALHDAFSANAGPGGYACKLGAVKANIGHAASAAGVAGFIKVCAMLQRKLIPGQINFAGANAAINLERTSFAIPTQTTHWDVADGMPRRAGVSSFGFGGTNAHVIVEEFVAPASQDMGADGYVSVPVTGKSAAAVQRYCDALATHVERHADLSVADVAWTLQHRREHFGYRKVVAARDRAGLVAALRAATPVLQAGREQPTLVFMFSGQGSQYANMGRTLYDTEPVYRDTVDTCARIVSAVAKCDFLALLFPATPSDALTQTRWSQPALFVTGYALARLLASKGIEPALAIGHSIGEYVAATLAGVFTLEDALFVVTKRGEFMQRMAAGSMLSVQAGADELAALLPAQLSVALHNGPRNVVVAGPTEAIEAFEGTLAQREVPCVRLHTSHAFHSPMMADAAARLGELLRGIPLRAPQRRFISNVTGAPITDAEACSPEYWARHLLQPVRFGAGIETVLALAPNPILLELGPGRVLGTLARQTAPGVACVATLPAAKDDADDAQAFHQAVGALWSLGYGIDTARCWETSGRQVVLPPYQFDRTVCWLPLPSRQQQVDVVAAVAAPTAPADHGPGATERLVAQAFQRVLGNDTLDAATSFFEVGGNSLSALHLAAMLNKVFDLSLSLAVLHRHPSIAALAAYIDANRGSYRALVDLNGARGKERLFMFHPGIGGCEVYTDLARSLADDFHCHGVDAYNLHHDDKIADLRELAAYYLARIDELCAQAPDRVIRLLGWSLGGTIAMEVAAQLEERGHRNIQLYLLDTVVDDATLAAIKGDPGYVSGLEEDYRTFLQSQDYPAAHIERSLPTIGLAVRFEATPLSRKLRHADVLLLKAMTVDAELADSRLKRLFEHATALAASNVDTLLATPQTQLQVVNLDACHHNDILDDYRAIHQLLLQSIRTGRAHAVDYAIK
ncbi:non-ribosomal peptide synthetase/type I polyketide synthase [Pseudoduganella chitinolytica]|uniref:Amino acid adenylation domain-containing protein n=1 Tax=Pseudoduganella chitinolytica TaxID=34070 RepID=A0ABY8BAH0_9BURK|nr:non-ribosomal peptide synthetase/type I polyketide synthase [Pseudoduganella chitinolytica]WEF32911.1 amino acid adenylation domain-containing protein [Pseudoduganella chitinolytica]